jgi:regulator of cell morphogenesis and NO signaling
MELEKELTVGALVAKDYRKAKVFKQYGIDFCCGGGISVSDACKAYNADFTAVTTALEELDKEPAQTNQNYQSWPIEKLIDYIESEHHTYVREAIPIVSQFVNKVKAVHGDNKPNVAEIADVFNALAEELQDHLMKEERILFPYLRMMAKAQNNADVQEPPFGSVQNPIRAMENEHDDAGEAIFKIKALTENYNPPKGACATHKVSYAYLKEFMDDLMKHVHLENNVLFPKALELEKE